MTVHWNTPLEEFPGVGEKRAKSLAKLGLTCAGDLLNYFPRDYEDRTQTYEIAAAPEGENVCIAALVAESPRVSYLRKGLELAKVKVADGTGILWLTFFNQSYIRETLRRGESFIFYGKVECSNGFRGMTNPAFEREGSARFTGRIMPKYPLTAGVSNNLLAGLTLRAVEGDCPGECTETLPQDVRERHRLPALDYCYRNIHFPESRESAELARWRFTFEELFYLAAGLAMLKGRRVSETGAVFSRRPPEEFLSLLPFAPTGAQRRVMAECAEDLASGRVMNRLVQGDVGSGKTVIAAYCGYLAAKSGAQAAMMAPTEILAEQHYRSLKALLEPAHVAVALLTGSMSAAEKKKLLAALRSGDIQFLVGTHAVISKGVQFQNLAMVIADEQHRFGVNQRAALSEKGDHPHVLVMSATPIPRTLALIIYGDLDVSVIDELPPGRTPIETFLVGESKRQRMYGFVEKLVGEGRQAYIVCPAVEESTDGESGMDLKAVTAYAHHLQTVIFPQLRVGFVHGKLKAREKEEVMGAFQRGELDVLVSTTVIEVGVDVPNAALMVVENAERFGLSQLHQLRGRVGRGKHQSYCVLVSGTRNEETRQRLKALCATTDGVRISEEDLKLRGPGDFFGARQHGLPALRLADLAGDMRVFKLAQAAAGELLAKDPGLKLAEHAPILEKIKRLFAENGDIFN